MPALGKGLVVLGVVIALVGVVLYLVPSVPWLGRLPGDIRIERPGFRFYFPITTSLLLSLAASGLLYLVTRPR